MIFWRAIRGVTADGVQDGQGQVLSRWLLCGDERYEFPIAHTFFHFSKERMDVIKRNLDLEKKQREMTHGE
jgi:hypothetical protein